MAAIGFGLTVAMWVTVYVGHIIFVNVPPALIFGVMLCCLLGGGFLAGRFSTRGTRTAIGAGIVSGVLNLLILGALLKSAPDASIPPFWIWVPGWIIGAGAIAGIGGLIGSVVFAKRITHDIDWMPVFAWVAVVATLLLITSGGLVTGLRAGLAVPDWPNSFGYNMFLFPLARMTGGIFYEHSHRLMGSLVGTTGLVLAIMVTAYRRRPAAVNLVWLVGICIAIQAALGGLRVIENSHTLALVHGFFAHLILMGLVTVAVLLTPRPMNADGKPWAVRGIDRAHATMLVGGLLLQIMVGATLRQLNKALIEHMTIGDVALFVDGVCRHNVRGILPQGTRHTLGRHGAIGSRGRANFIRFRRLGIPHAFGRALTDGRAIGRSGRCAAAVSCGVNHNDASNYGGAVDGICHVSDGYGLADG